MPEKGTSRREATSWEGVGDSPPSWAVLGDQGVALKQGLLCK